MSEVTRADIDRIHGRLDEALRANVETQVTVARIEERMKAIQPPAARPCPPFEAHVREHREAEMAARQTWRDVALRVLGPTLAGFGGALAAILGFGGGRGT